MAPPWRGAAVALAAAAGVPLAAYLWALHPGLAAGDAGELVTAAATGGVAHPPGYPLYVMAGWLWLKLWAHASPAWAMNLFSALCMAGTAAVLAAAVRRASGSWSAGVLAAWLFAASPPVFTNALVAEVFALHALLAACALLAMVSAPAAGAVVLAFLCTLALSHQHTLLLLAVPGFVACTTRSFRRPTGRVRIVAGSGVAAVVGLLPLLWIPHAARSPHALVWGEPTTLRGFVSLLLGAEYDPVAAGHESLAAPLVAFARALPADLSWVGLALAALGAWRLWATRREAATALATTAVLIAWSLARQPQAPTERFHILPVLVLAFLVGRGSLWLATWLGRAAWVQEFTLYVLLALAFALGTTRVTELSQRDNRLVETLGRGMLASVPRDGVLFSGGRVIPNALGYLQRIEHLRPDVIALDQELMTYAWYVRRVRARHPDVLPPLDRAERITLTDGSTVDGVAVRHGDGTTDLLSEAGERTVESAIVVRIVPAAAESLFATAPVGTDRPSRTDTWRAPWLDPSEDRYSGLPGSRNLLWFDALVGGVPVCMLGPKDNSYTLRYQLEPRGFVQLVRPHGDPASELAEFRAALAAIDATDLAVYFRGYTPTSLEAPELERFTIVVTDAALLLAKAGGGEPSRARDRVREFARRFETLEPAPDPACLRAIGFLRFYDPGFRDLDAARKDLERALRASPDPGRDIEAQRLLETIRQGPR
ncbi:MAG TPA: DUF2723 domain-containing protein [Methylomirabilota bacterium]|nr:DUF2723 domain-containing protein [Methylomirabilota bacterium]